MLNYFFGTARRRAPQHDDSGNGPSDVRSVSDGADGEDAFDGEASARDEEEEEERYPDPGPDAIVPSIEGRHDDADDEGLQEAPSHHGTLSPASGQGSISTPRMMARANGSPPFRPSPWDRGSGTATPEILPRLRGRSPDLVAAHDVPMQLARGVRGYTAAWQPVAPLPAPGRDDSDAEDAEQRAWETVFNSEEYRDIARAVLNYLNVASFNSFLARIADVHGEDEMITRRRFAHRYADHRPLDDDSGLLLYNMLMDEVALSAYTPAEVDRRWQMLLRRIEQLPLLPRLDTIYVQQTRDELQNFMDLYGFHRWMTAFRQTHGQRPLYHHTVGAFFPTGSEEVDLPDGWDPDRAADAVTAWVLHPERHLTPGSYTDRETHWDRDMASRRLDDVEEDDCRADIDEAESLRLIQRALAPQEDRPFTWGRLYLRLLRHIEMFGAQTTLSTYQQHIPTFVRGQLRHGAGEVLRHGYMRLGANSLAALLADWMAPNRGDEALLPLLRAPRVNNTRTTPEVDLSDLRDELEIERVRVQELEEELRKCREHGRELKARLWRAEHPSRPHRPGSGQSRAATVIDLTKEDEDDAELVSPTDPPRPHGSPGSGSESDLYGETPPPQSGGYQPQNERPVNPTRHATTPPSPSRSSLDDVFPNEDISDSDSSRNDPSYAEPSSGTRRGRGNRRRGSYSEEGSRKRPRGGSGRSDGRVPSRTPPGRRRRPLDHVAIPATTAPAAAPAPAVPAGDVRLTRAMIRAGHGTLSRGL